MKALDTNMENVGLSKRALNEVAERYMAVDQRSTAGLRRVF